MSVSSEQEVHCPCGEDFVTTLWSAVNGQTDPALREAILAGQLNVVRCPNCGQMIYAERFLLYHDPARELLAFVYPKDHELESATWRQKTHDDFETAQNALEPDKRLKYLPFPLFGMDALVALLEEEQEAEDQGAIVESLAVSAQVDICQVPPSFARQHHLPLCLPLRPDGGKQFADRLKEGLRSIIEANDRLSVYAAFLDRFSRNPGELSVILRSLSPS